jgi:branched-chain amino acid transport system permease protein
MTANIQLLMSGLALGAVYALIALGFVVIYRASQVFNFAQGEYLTFGAFLMISLSALGIPWGLAVIGAMLGTGLLAAITERVVLRPMVGKPVFATIILTIFVGMILRSTVILIWGANPRGMPTPWETTATVNFFGSHILVNSLGAVVAGGVALGAFFLLLKYTRIGVAMRATSSDQEASLGLGIPVGRIFGTTWFIAGLYAALAGIFLGMFPRSVDANLGFIALRAMPAVIVGGLDSALGVVIAGLLLGVLEVLAQGHINPHLGSFGQNFHTVFPYVIMILVLMIRPQGLMGSHQVKRV